MLVLSLAGELNAGSNVQPRRVCCRMDLNSYCGGIHTVDERTDTGHISKNVAEASAFGKKNLQAPQ